MCGYVLIFGVFLYSTLPTRILDWNAECVCHWNKIWLVNCPALSGSLKTGISNVNVFLCFIFLFCHCLGGMRFSCHLNEWLSILLCLCVFFVCLYLHSLGFFFSEEKKSRKKRKLLAYLMFYDSACLYTTRKSPEVMEHWTRRLYSSCWKMCPRTFHIIHLAHVSFSHESPSHCSSQITMCHRICFLNFQIRPFFYQHHPLPPFLLPASSCFLLLYKVFQSYHLYIMMYGYDNVLYYGKMRKIYFCYQFVS